MPDVSSFAYNGGLASAIVAIIIALAEWLKTRNAKKITKKFENIPPSFDPATAADTPKAEIEKQVVFERSRSVPSIDLIARVETYVRAEGDLRIQLAKKDWEYKELLEERDAALQALQEANKQINAMRTELDELYRQIRSSRQLPALQSPHGRNIFKHPARDDGRVSRSAGHHSDSSVHVDRTQDRQADRKKHEPEGE
jgi:methyl-accepting chemotaxis protein